jgi:hypothetical protein
MNITMHGTARHRLWRNLRLRGLGLVPAAAMLLATAAAVPASASRNVAVPVRAAAVSPAPAGLRAAVRAALGGPAGRPATGTLAPRDGQADFFGFSVAVSGNTALVGGTTAHHHTGAVYVFVHRATGWVQQARLTAADGFARDAFGDSVALDGNTAVIGAENRGLDALRSFQGIGGAYVFVRDGSTWSQQALLLPDPADAVTGEFFGRSVGLSGQTVLVGAPGDGNEQGAVFGFTRTGTTWSQTAKFTGSNSVQFDTFGWSLAFSGHRAVVGAPQQGGFTGEAYVFTQSGTRFTQQAALAGPHRQAGDLFGRSVALSGSTALVGAPGVPANGSAYVFVRTGTRWTRQARLTVAAPQFGSLGQDAVTVRGNTAVVGADPSPANFTGAAFEFVRTGTHWALKATFTDPAGVPGDRLGQSVAIAGATTLVGVPGHNVLHGEVDLFPL